MEKALDLPALIQSDGASAAHLHTVALSLITGEKRKVLDLGCGRGDLARRIVATGHAQVFACDGFAHGEIGRSGIPFVLADLNRSLPFADGEFSNVLAIEVIEHLENPRAFIREIIRILSPGGQAIVSTPNNFAWTSLLSVVLRGYFSAFADRCYPAHITALLPVDLTRIVQEAGLENARLIFSNTGRLPGVAISWQRLSFGLLRGPRFSDNVFITAFKPPLR